jgi:hypothetical protein
MSRIILTISAFAFIGSLTLAPLCGWTQMPTEMELDRAKAALAAAFRIDPNPATSPLSQVIPPPLLPATKENKEAFRQKRILPPLEFDKPYTGYLLVVPLTKGEMAEKCPKTIYPITLACSFRNFTGPDTCKIYIISDRVIEEAGWTREIVMRHELAHCEGWLADHKGARSIEEAEKASAKR